MVDSNRNKRKYEYGTVIGEMQYSKFGNAMSFPNCWRPFATTPSHNVAEDSSILLFL